MKTYKNVYDFLRQNPELHIKNSNELIIEFMRAFDFSKEDALLIIGELVDIIAYMLFKNGYINIRGLGFFYIKAIKKVRLKNRINQKKVTVPLRYRIRFVPANKLRNFINTKAKENIKMNYLVQETIKEGEEDAKQIIEWLSD